MASIRFRRAWLTVFAFVLAQVIPAAAQSDAAGEPHLDAQISVEDLAIHLRPLTKAELLAAAEAWSERLQAKAREVSLALIAARQSADADEAAGAAAGRGPTGADRVTELQGERTQLIDKLRTVVDTLDSKTDAADSETQAKIADYRLYMASVSGVHVDVSDARSAWNALWGWLTQEEGGLRWAWNIAVFLGLLLVARLLAGLASRVLRHAFERVEWPELLENFLVGAAYWAIMVAGFLVALSALEVSMGPLLAMVGAAGFVVAFAMQDSLSNFASGLMILTFRPFDTGDTIEAAGVSGTVESMNLVATTIMTFDNKRMIVPNNSIIGDVITNATGVDVRRVDLEFGIGYDDDIDRAKTVLEEIVRGHALVLEDPEPIVRVAKLADSSVNFIARPWVETPDYWTVYWDLTREVKQRFDSEGIGIPFPQRDVHLHLADAAAKPDLTAGARESGHTPNDRGEET